MRIIIAIVFCLFILSCSENDQQKEKFSLTYLIGNPLLGIDTLEVKNDGFVQLKLASGEIYKTEWEKNELDKFKSELLSYQPCNKEARGYSPIPEEQMVLIKLETNNQQCQLKFFVEEAKEVGDYRGILSLIERITKNLLDSGKVN